MKELRNFIVPDDVYYLILSHIEKSNRNERVSDMTKERFLEVYDVAVKELRSQILDNDEYYAKLSS